MALFIQDYILGMKWLNSLVGRILISCGINLNTHIGASLQFFFYDVIKISILLCVLIFLVSYIQSYFPPERTRKILGRFNGLTANTMAALLGTITPFCSCSSIPLFMGFTSAGLPIGVTFSFLISSPMVDLGSLVLISSIFGFRLAVAYVLLGLLIAIVGGSIIEKLGMESYVEDYILSAQGTDVSLNSLSWKERIAFAIAQVQFTFRKVFPYILVGVGIGAIIHNWVPEDVIASLLGRDNPIAVILATLVGVPMYADIFGTIPIAEALLTKGAQLGSVLALMMAVTTLSLPSLIMLKKAVKIRLLATCKSICPLNAG